MNEKPTSKECYADSPVVWFVVLERARRDNDFELAAKARQELDRLGVIADVEQLKRSFGFGGRQRGPKLSEAE